MNEQNNGKWVFTPDVKEPISVKSEDQFLSSNQLFTAILESIQDGVSVIDTSLHIKYANASMKYWYSDEEVFADKRCYEVYHNRKSPCKDCPSLKAIASRQPEVELVRYRKGGSDYGWQQLYAVPVLDKDGEVILVIEYIRDITMQKFIEHNLFDLEERFSHLEQQNRLLAQMMEQREKQREELERTVNENVEKFIKPSLNYIKNSIKSKEVDMVSGMIDEIVYPITKKRLSAISALTAKEMQIATLIKENYTSKEIAEKLFVTKKAVDYHRTNIRKKLGLSREANLTVYLKTHL